MRTRKEPTEPAEAEREPARPIGYGRWAQRADRRHGIRDGRNRIPSLAEVHEILEASGPVRMPTPYLEMLFSRARDMMEHERLWYIATTVKVRSELAQLDGQAQSARMALGPAEAARAKAYAEVTEEDLRARHSIEELRSEQFIRMRREAEREQRIERAEQHYLTVLSSIHAIEIQLSLVRDTVQSRLSIARMRALRISAYLSARTAVYWEGLIHAHRDGRHLAPLLPALIPRLPSWVVPEEFDSPDSMPAWQPLTGSPPPVPTSAPPAETAAPGFDMSVNPPQLTPTPPPHEASRPAHNPPAAAGGAHGQTSQAVADEQPVPSHRS